MFSPLAFRIDFYLNISIIKTRKGDFFTSRHYHLDQNIIGTLHFQRVLESVLREFQAVITILGRHSRHRGDGSRTRRTVGVGISKIEKRRIVGYRKTSARSWRQSCILQAIKEAVAVWDYFVEFGTNYLLQQISASTFHHFSTITDTQVYAITCVDYFRKG